jgi:hypothetical protein
MQSCGDQDAEVGAQAATVGQVLPVLCNVCQTSKAAYRVSTGTEKCTTFRKRKVLHAVQAEGRRPGA